MEGLCQQTNKHSMINFQIMRKAIYCALFMLLFSCRYNLKVPEIDINTEITAYQKNIGKGTDTATIDLGRKLSLDKWNYLLIVHPYAQEKDIEQLHLKPYQSIKNEIENIGSSDFYYLFIFLSDKNIVAYSKVRSSLVYPFPSTHPGSFNLIKKNEISSIFS